MHRIRILFSLFTFICTESTIFTVLNWTDAYYVAITGDRNNSEIDDPIEKAFESLQLKNSLSRSGFKQHEADLTAWTDFAFAREKTLSSSLDIDSGLDAFATYFRTFDESVNVYGKLVLCKQCRENGEYTDFSSNVDETFVSYAPVYMDIDLAENSISYGTQTKDYIKIYISSWWVFKDGNEENMKDKKDELWSNFQDFTATSLAIEFAGSDDDILGQWYDVSLKYTDLHKLYLDFNNPSSWSNTYDAYYECSGSAYCVWIYKVHLFCSNEAFCGQYLRMTNANDTTTTSSTTQSASDKSEDETKNSAGKAFGIIILVLVVIGIIIGVVYFVKRKKKGDEMLYQQLSAADNPL